MPGVLIIVVILAVVFIPGLWVNLILKRYSRPRDRYACTGAELARRLLDRKGLTEVTVEVAPSGGGDHYDPEERVVRLTKERFNGRSLTDVTVAAHEVGHACQDATGYRPLRWRTRLVGLAKQSERVGVLILMISPMVAVVTRAPLPGAFLFLGGLLVIAMGTIVHLVTLPVEFDASFERALPMLREGGHLRAGDERHARRLLKATAMTYVAASLMSLLNVARWWAVLRR